MPKTTKPKVLIEVSGGVADYRTLGDVDVLLVDWDSIKSEEADTPSEYDDFDKTCT